MKLYISADIEGSAGITHWDETDYDRGGRWYDYFREQMSREVSAACEGALAAGAGEVVVKDAHDLARNLLPTSLPRGVMLHRGWARDPLCMVTGLDESFDALAMTGYHAPAGSNGNPLAHTMTTHVDEVTLNGARISEFVISAYTAGYYGVAVPFLSGDTELCEMARALVPGITAVAVSAGRGNGSLAMQPADAVDAIRAGMQTALSGNLDGCRVTLPTSFEVRVRYVKHPDAYKHGFYPGAKQLDAKTIGFETSDWYEVLRFFQFVL